MSGLTDRQKEIRRRLKDDRPLYFEKCLRILTKVGGEPGPFRLNSTQRYIDERLDRQLAETGRVRALVLKARQTGVSTYVQGRFYHKVTHGRGLRAFILTHHQSATDNLFNMTNRFHEHVPPRVRPATGKCNAKELNFDRLDSGYSVATAGTSDVGRSQTIQFFHGSEVAMWPNAESHVEGVGQAVSKASGSEIILESTAKGLNNLFANMWKQAVAGKSDYIAIFVPWFMHEEYAAEPPPDWECPEDPSDPDAIGFRTYQDMYGLTDAQLFWAWRENRELANTINAPDDCLCWKFQQEYPANAEEAFQTAGVAAFISSVNVVKARKREVDAYGPMVLGVDVGRGGDPSAFVDLQMRRLGMNVCKTEDFGEDLMRVAAAVTRHIEKLLPLGLVKVVIDVTGLGAGVYDRLKQGKHARMIEGVNFGAAAYEAKRFANRRAEIYWNMAEWFKDKEGLGVQCADTDEFQADLTALQWGEGNTRYRPNGQLVLEEKDHVKKRLQGKSPDLADAAACCFALDLNELLTESDLSWNNFAAGIPQQTGWMGA